MGFEVKEELVYLTHPPASVASETAPRVAFSAAPPPDGLVDHAIEGHDQRRHLRPGEGILCLTVAPGDALGAVAVNVQYEGPIGAWDECVESQDQALGQALTWLEDFFASFAGDFEATLHHVPCPKASGPTVDRVFVEVSCEVGHEVENQRRARAERDR